MFREPLYWCFHGEVDEVWLGEQLVRMLKAGFVPSDAYEVVEWLQGIAPRQIDRAVEAVRLLLRNPRTDRWAYMTKREPIREILEEGLKTGFRADNRLTCFSTWVIASGHMWVKTDADH